MLPRRQIAQPALELRALALEIGPAAVDLLNPSRLGDTEAAAPDDGETNDDEETENRPDDRPPTRGPGAATRLSASYAARRHRRSLALRARGLRRVSSASAVIARRVTNSPSATPRQVHCGCFGGQMQSRLHSRIACLARRSSPEWYAITARTPPKFSRSRMTGSASSSALSSSFTRMRSDWKRRAKSDGPDLAPSAPRIAPTKSSEDANGFRSRRFTTSRASRRAWGSSP